MKAKNIMKIKTWSKLDIIILVVSIVLACSPVIYAAVTKLDVLHTTDGWGVEPFKGSSEIRSSAVLTTAYVDTDVVDTAGYSQVMLCFNLTRGSLTSFQYRVWMSQDNVNWYREATEDVSSGEITDEEAFYSLTFADDVDYFKVIPCYGAYLKLSVKGTGTVTGSACAVTVVGVR